MPLIERLRDATAPINPHVEVEERKEAENESHVWTVRDNIQSRMGVRTEWQRSFNANVDKVASTIATSIIKEMSEKLSHRLKSSFEMYPTSAIPFHVTYRLSLLEGAAEMKKWAKETAELAPFKAWFEHFISLEKSLDKERIDRGDYGSSFGSRVPQGPVDTAYFDGMIDLLGNRVEKFVKEQISAFRENVNNLSLEYKTAWNPKSSGSMLSSKSGSSSSSLHITAWLDDVNVKELQKQEAQLMESLRAPQDGGLQLPPARSQQPRSSSQCVIQ